MPGSTEPFFLASNIPSATHFLNRLKTLMRFFEKMYMELKVYP
jgi:hypothetical protein